MKYLKIFEEFTTNDVKYIFEKHIDWDFIKDVRDMALDYIGDDLTLVVSVDYKAVLEKYVNYKPVNTNATFTILKYSYNHNNESFNWHNEIGSYLNVDNFYNSNKVTEDRIYYKIFFYRGEFIHSSNLVRLYQIKDINNLAEDIKSYYPNKSIKLLSSAILIKP